MYLLVSAGAVRAAVERGVTVPEAEDRPGEGAALFRVASKFLIREAWRRYDGAKENNTEAHPASPRTFTACQNSSREEDDPAQCAGMAAGENPSCGIMGGEGNYFGGRPESGPHGWTSCSDFQLCRAAPEAGDGSQNLN